MLSQTPRGTQALPHDPEQGLPLVEIPSVEELWRDATRELPEPELAAARNGSKPDRDLPDPALRIPRGYHPLVSVVVPCRNDERFLPSVLASILSQDYDNIECIVCDGGSTDGTVALLRRYGDKISWVSEADHGSFDAINRGWRMAKGDILAWLNADDQWTPQAVTAAVAFFAAHASVDVVYGTCGVIDEVGRIHGDMVPKEWQLSEAVLNCDHIIFQAASFMRRRIIEEVDYLRHGASDHAFGCASPGTAAASPASTRGWAWTACAPATSVAWRTSSSLPRSA